MKLMTVGELRKLLDGVDDSLEIVVRASTPMLRTNRSSQSIDAAKRDTWIEALEWALHNPETIRIVDTLVKLRAEKEKGR